MISQISEGVKVSVETFYQEEYSNPYLGDFMFAYRITIENHNNFPVQLLSRHWYIFDSKAENREVQGDGVVGMQPVIDSDSSYQYMSGCNLKSDMGKMHGTYFMENCFNKKRFKIRVPIFEMIAPFRLN